MRNQSVDTLRTIATLLVVLLHVAAPFVTEGVRSKELDFNFSVGNSVDSFTRICVPLFVMISGMFLLGRQETVLDSYRKRASKMLIPLIFWSAFYLTYQYSLGIYTQFDQLLSLFITGNPFYHLWYLFMIMGLYLITPFINQFIARSSERQHWILTVVLVLFAMLNTAFDAPLGTPPFFLLWFINYLGYFMLGYLLSRVAVSVSSGLLLGLYILSGLLIAILTQKTILASGTLSYYGYNTPLVFVGAVAVFLLVLKMEFRVNYFTRVSHLTFGVYLFHAFVLDVLNRRLSGSAIFLFDHALIGIPLRFLLVSLLSFAFVSLLYRSPLLRKCIG